jgi:DNA-binding response OmpR family regulator
MLKKVLILDDEPVTMRALALDLRDAGYRVDMARDGEEAARRFDGRSFDLLIASARSMADVGPESANWWKRVKPAAKVVLMTTEMTRRGSVEISDSGATVHKPFDLEELRNVVERLLGPDPTMPGKAS